MVKWLSVAFFCVGGTLAVLKHVGVLWCLIELRRKWRAVPELWGIDWLDVVYRVERRFGVALSAADFMDWLPEVRAGLAAGQLWELVAGKLRAGGVEVPTVGWDRLVTLLSEALNVKASRIERRSRLYADLGMVYGVE